MRDIKIDYADVQSAIREEYRRWSIADPEDADQILMATAASGAIGNLLWKVSLLASDARSERNPQLPKTPPPDPDVWIGENVDKKP